MKRKSEDQRIRDKIVGEKLRSIRKRRGITQPELGQLLGVHENTIVGYEKGTTTLDPEYRKIIIEKLGLHDNYFDFEKTTPLKYDNTIVEEPIEKYDNNKKTILTHPEMIGELILQNRELIEIISRHSRTIENLSYKVKEQGEIDVKKVQGKAS